ncbi:MAG: glycosyltransferase [Ktedonobacterales bacterium]
MPLSIVQIVGNVATGGAERHVLDLVQGLQENGTTVEVICPRSGPLTDRLAERHIPTTCIEMVVPQPGDDYALKWEVVQRLMVWLRRKRPDVVHSHLYPAHLHASLAAYEVGIPAILQTAHTLVVRTGDVLLSRLMPAHTIAVSQMTAELLQGAGIPPERLTVILNGIDLESLRVTPEQEQATRATLPPSGGAPIVSTVCRLSPEKGVDILLDATQLLSTWGVAVSVLIAGDGPLQEALCRHAAHLALTGTVHFLGARRDVATLNHIADLFVLPSRQEACPLAVLEAMAAGKAVLATTVGGIPEMVTHRVDGWLVAPDDPVALAEAMRLLLGDHALRAQLGAAARQRVGGQFTRQRMVQETLQLYQQLLATR